MSWKEHLTYLESSKKWDEAIGFMQEIINNNLNDMDAYIFMNYLLMNLLVEENYDVSKQDNYITLARWYFNESYSKFSDNPEYLYLTAKTASMCESFYGIDVKDYEQMIERAHTIDPSNSLYNEQHYWALQDKDPTNPGLIAYAKMILSDNSPIEQQLKAKGAVGEYVLMLKKGWGEEVLWNAENA